MNLSIIKKDFKRNKSINITLLSFIILSAFLMSVATIIIIQLFSSIDSMYEIAKPPHFMQMHVGDIDQEEIDRFAESVDYVEDWQTVEMVNIYSGNISINKSDGTTFTLSDSLLDMGWVKQNEQFDLLLDMENKPYQPLQGQIGVPLLLLDTYNIEIGDTITVKDGEFSMDFIVDSIVRDPQMNAALVSSTRFIISEQDHNILKENTGKVEYLIEFYLNDVSLSAKFQTAYEKAGMPANGQGVTYGMIRLLSGFSDMMMVVVLFLVSFSIIFVVFICLRFTILTVMEEEVNSIGTMKAIGMSHKNITQIYMMKYRILTIVGCIIGYMLSIFTSHLFTSHISKTFGAPKVSFLSIFVPILTVFLVYILEVHFSKRIMKKIKKITVVDALVSGGDRDKNKISKMVKLFSLYRLKKLPVNVFIGVRQVMVKSKSWFVMLFVMVIATSIILIPLNLLNTLQSPLFITYMGQSRNDIVISVTTIDDLANRYNEILNIIIEDNDIKNYYTEARVKYEAINKDGEWIYVRVDMSDQAKSELQYLKGNAPSSNNEIALSVMNADELGVSVGDRLTMKIEGEELEITVIGIYQDVTSGGYTAKMNRSYKISHVEKFTFFINLNKNVDIGEKVEELKGLIGVDVKVTDMEEFANQTLGGVAIQLSKALYASSVMVVCLVALITLLFLKLQTVKEYSQIAIMKALGFSVLDIRKQYLVKVSFVSLIGILFGTLLANIFGEIMVSNFLSIIGFGISSISFIINPLEAYIVVPLIILAIVLIVTWYTSRAFKKYHIIEIINE